MRGSSLAMLLPTAALAAWALLLAGVVGLAFTLNAFAPIRRSRWLVVPSSLFSMLAAELATQHLLWQVIGVGALIALGALEHVVGWIGLGLSATSWIGLFALVMKGRGAVGPITSALDELGVPSTPFELHYARLLNPLPLRFDRKRVHRNIEYAHVAGRRLRLDVHLPSTADEGLRPAVIQIHGGGWVVGDKREQGRPILAHMAKHGFVGFNVNYRLSPGATFPDHLIDIKRAIAWVREHAAEFRVDPSFIAVTGGSAGGHLAAMAALTAGQTRFQPGFEDADTTVQAAIPLYGIYDLSDRSARHAPGFHAMLLEPLVIKAFLAEEPEKFTDASPITHVGPDAPPFFVIHGDRDTMAPLEDARDFVAELRRASHQPVLFAEIGGGQHAFDVFVSPRSLPVIHGVGRFLEHLYAQHRRARDTNVRPASLRSAREGMQLLCCLAVLGALISACTSVHHDAAAGSTSGDPPEIGTDASSETTGPSGPPLPPRPDTIACRFDGNAPGLLPPVVVTPLGDAAIPAIDLAAGDEVFYVADEGLRIVAVDTDGAEIVTVIDLADRAARLVALAVPADHAQTGHLYVRYEASGGVPRAVIARLTIDPSTHVADPETHRVVMELADAVGERSGGALAFGPDQMLYIGVGALASASTQALAPNPTSRLGKLLRIDVSTLDATGTYATPADNPFAGQGGASDEVWAVGLRDPWRCTFAPDDPRPWCVDVGANEQEVDHIDARMNLGWPYAEGAQCLLPNGDCNDLLIDPPLATYRAVDGDCGIAGVVLGTSGGPPELAGALVYVDRCSGRIRGLDTESAEVLVQADLIGVIGDPTAGIVQDATGRLLVLSESGIGELSVATDDAEFPTTLAASGCFDDIATLTPTPGLVPYAVNAELWSDGAIKDRFLLIPPGETMRVTEDGAIDFPVGSVILKLFSFEYVVGDPTTRAPVEARVVVRRELGWQFHSYRFDDEGRDATLLSTGEERQIEIDDGGHSIAFDYFWPSRGSCKVCHGSDDASPLGPRLDQLDRTYDYGDGVANQLDAMTSIGLFSGPLPMVEPMPAPDDFEASTELRARAYLHTNCGHCHRPGGWTPAGLTMDLRYTTPLSEAFVCDVETQYFNPLATGMVRIAPGDPDESVIWERINVRGTGQMPPLATSRVDPGASIVGDWIAGLSECPQ